jgi:predicted SAM-dependent methyltransferase
MVGLQQGLLTMFLRPRSWLPQPIIALWDAIRFDVLTGWGQFWQRPHDGGSFDHLQVGSYDSRFAGFLNADHYSNRSAAAYVDIRYRLPFADDRWTGIFAHHTVEHVAYDDAMTFFREAARTLKPGGWLRVVVPDVEKFMRLYCSGDPDRVRQMAELIPEWHRASIAPKTALGVVNNMFFSSPSNSHRSAWDFETLASSLQQAGFRRVERMGCGVSNDPKMSGLDNAAWEAHSLYVEAGK